MKGLENTVLETSNYFNPDFYIRYCDDTLVHFRSSRYVSRFIQELEKNSVLKFTCEHACENSISFLDILITDNKRGSLDTGVYIKTSDKGVYLDYNSHCPERYKVNTIKTLIHRAYRTCSNWELFHVEVERIRKNLVNSNYPLYIVDQHIGRQLSNLHTPRQPPTQMNKIKFFIETENPTSLPNEEKSLRNIMDRHLQPTQPNTKIQVNIYYRSSRLSGKLSTRTRGSSTDHVV